MSSVAFFVALIVTLATVNFTNVFQRRSFTVSIVSLALYFGSCFAAEASGHGRWFFAYSVVRGATATGR